MSRLERQLWARDAVRGLDLLSFILLVRVWASAKRKLWVRDAVRGLDPSIASVSGCLGLKSCLYLPKRVFVCSKREDTGPRPWVGR